MVLLIRTRGNAPEAIAYVLTKERALEIVNMEISLAIEEAGMTESEVDDSLTFYPDGVFLETFDDEIHWDIFDVENIEHIE
jgi:hypothetical protein